MRNSLINSIPSIYTNFSSSAASSIIMSWKCDLNLVFVTLMTSAYSIFYCMNFPWFFYGELSPLLVTSSILLFFFIACRGCKYSNRNWAAYFLIFQFVSVHMPVNTLKIFGSTFNISSPFASIIAQNSSKPILRQGYCYFSEGKSIIRFTTY